MSQSDPTLTDRLAAVLGRTPTLNEETAAYVGAKHAGGADAVWVPTIKVFKYHPDKVAYLTRRLGHEPLGHDLRTLEKLGHVAPDETTEASGNLLTTLGLNRLTNLWIGGGAAAATNAQTFAGIGDATTAATVADTALGAATNKWYQGADATYPTQSNGVLTVNCTVATGNGNYVWNEWVLGIATGTITAGSSIPGTSPTLINHKVYAAGGLGTKVSGAVWTLQATITLA